MIHPDTVWRIRPSRRRGCVAEIHFGTESILYLAAWVPTFFSVTLADQLDIDAEYIAAPEARQ